MCEVVVYEGLEGDVVHDVDVVDVDVVHVGGESKAGLADQHDGDEKHLELALHTAARDYNSLMSLGEIIKENKYSEFSIPYLIPYPCPLEIKK